MSIPELNPNIQLNSFYFSQSKSWLVFVVAIRKDWVYYTYPNLFDGMEHHMKINEFSQKFEKVAFIQKQNENSQH